MVSIVFFLVVCTCIFSDDPQEQSSEEDIRQSPLFQETLMLDIDSANYYELVTWCRELGMSDSGSRKELQSRIMTYYNIDHAAAGKKAEQQLEVQSAKESEYFTIEEVDENYIMLQGDVILHVADTKSGNTHTIKAQKIIYNQTSNTITAEGEIEYTLKQKQGTETFRADSFNIFF